MNTGRAALRLRLEASAIPGVAGHYEAMQRAETLAARAIVRRELSRRGCPGTSVTLLLDTLVGGAMVHAMSTPADRRAELARTLGSHAGRLVDFLMRRGHHRRGGPGMTAP